MDQRWKTALGVAAGVAGALVGASLVRRRLFERTVDQRVDMLYSDLARRPKEAIREDDLSPLPEPVQRYLRFAGVVGRRPTRSVRALQTGDIRLGPDKKWLPFEAVQYYSAAPPGFVWYADVHANPVASFQIRDHFMGGRGAVVGQLAGALPVVDSAGPAIDQGSAVRFLNEMVFFPTAFLEDYVHWEAVDDRRARVHMQHWSGDVSALCHFADDGRMIDFAAQRYREEGDSFHKREWRTPFGEYAEVDGFRVPGSGRAIWKLESGDFEYIRLQATEVTHDDLSSI